MRRFILWLSGRDLLAPPLPPSPPFVITGWPAPLWEWTFDGGYFKAKTPQAPNALNRAMQRLVLGIRWTLLPNTGAQLPPLPEGQ